MKQENGHTSKQPEISTMTHEEEEEMKHDI